MTLSQQIDYLQRDLSVGLEKLAEMVRLIEKATEKAVLK